MPTVSEVAKHAGVSKSTVSLALNNKPGVSDAMRRRVLNSYRQLLAREEMRVWSPAKNLGGAATLATSSLSLVVLHPPILRSSQVFSELLQGIQAGATAHQIQLSLAVNEPGLPPDHITRLYFSDRALRPDGVLVIGAQLDEPLLQEARRLDLPCVLVGRQTDEPGLSAVGRNEEESALAATSYLLELGHRSIAFAGGETVYAYTHSRLRGYRRALRDCGITPLERWVALGGGKEAAQALLENSPEITAVIFVNDAYAMEGLPVFQAAGIRIPQDLSVISFDDTDAARASDPPLTSVLYPRFQEGLWSVKVLVDLIREPLMTRCSVVFRSSLIQRQSCSPPRGPRLLR